MDLIVWHRRQILSNSIPFFLLFFRTPLPNPQRTSLMVAAKLKGEAHLISLPFRLSLPRASGYFPYSGKKWLSL